jgi:hypothetical protein
MRISFLVYGLLYIMVELIGEQIEAIGWPHLTALEVATAVVNALVTVIVAVAVLIAGDVLVRRWRRSAHAWQLERARLAAEQEEDEATITVQAWRPEPLALPAGPPPSTPSAVYAANAYAGAPGEDDWIEAEIVEDDRLL